MAEPIKAGELAKQLMRHPDAVVQISLPKEMFVLGVGTYFGNDNGTLEPPCDKGVHMLNVKIGDWI